MKYTVLRYFTDLQDKGYAYKEGDVYPREGLSPSRDRIEALASGNNKRHIPLIQALPEETEAVSPAEAPAEDSPAEKESKPKRRKKRDD
jgi:hypothetical protein